VREKNLIFDNLRKLIIRICVQVFSFDLFAKQIFGLLKEIPQAIYGDYFLNENYEISCKNKQQRTRWES